MDDYFLRIFFILRRLLSQKETKVILIATLIGGISQIIAIQYIKNHPDFFSEEKEKNKNRQPRLRRVRGGDREFEKLKLLWKVFQYLGGICIKFASEKGVVAGFLGGSTLVGVANVKIPATAVSTITRKLGNYLQDGFPQNLPHLEKKRIVRSEGLKVYLELDQCDQNLEYLFSVVQDSNLPFEDKKEIIHSILTKYLNLKTVDGRLNFVLCMVAFLLYIFSIKNMADYHLILKNLIKSIQQGKIPKVVGRAIIRKLKRKGLPINPELIEAVNS